MTDDASSGSGDREPLAAQVLRLAEMVAYQDGSIVSRTLLKRDSGTVTLFAFDAGQELSEHSVPFDALVQVLDGEAEITVSGESFDVAAGQALLMAAGAPHSVAAPSRFKMLLTLLRG